MPNRGYRGARIPRKNLKSISKNLREIMSITPKPFIEFLNEKYNCSVSVQIREVSELGKKIRKELCEYHKIGRISGWGIDKNGWKHSKRAKGWR
jgi:hypothetical protein